MTTFVTPSGPDLIFAFSTETLYFRNKRPYLTIRTPCRAEFQVMGPLLCSHVVKAGSGFAQAQQVSRTTLTIIGISAGLEGGAGERGRGGEGESSGVGSPRPGELSGATTAGVCTLTTVGMGPGVLSV